MARRDWEGQPLKMALDKWGAPLNTRETPDGQTEYEWSFAHTETYQKLDGGTTTLVAPNVYEQTNTYKTVAIHLRCDLYITTGIQHVITKFSTIESQLGACVKFYDGIGYRF